MAGIYLHIPFCKSKCHYCNFYSMASVKYKAEFLKVIHEEIVLQKDYLGDQTVNTIYFGGGTPSLLSAYEIDGLISSIFKHYKLHPKAEITLEANPDDINSAWLKQISTQTAINRFSLGVQSFIDKDLEYLNRIHSGVDAEKAILSIQDSGFTNLSIDLIYGIPGLSDEGWSKNLQKFLEFDIPHLSAYALTVEERTALHKLIEKGKMQAPIEAETISQFNILLEIMERGGYIHYEISNFARDGYYSKHNSIYWAGGHYLGLGPSAHSYNGHSRRWNKSSMKEWLSLKEYYSESYEEEFLSTDQRYNEYTMTSLRTVWGCNIELVKSEFGDDYARHLMKEAEQFIIEGKIEQKKNSLYLTNKGKLFADGIASALFR